MGSQSGGKSEATMVWGVGVWNIYIEINREKKNYKSYLKT